MDINQIMNVVAPAGIFGFLFVWLFFKYMAESKERESKLIQALDKFASCFTALSDDVAETKDDVAEIKKDVEELKGK